MAKFAPVAPIQILEGLESAHVLGGYHLLLTHHILEYPQRHKDLFAFKPGIHETVIIDNSLVELGYSENDTKVFEAYDLLRGPMHNDRFVPVLTDVMGDGAATREAIPKSYANWQQMCQDAEIEMPNLMAVLQGNDWFDFCVTTDAVLLNPAYRHITWVGIPRILADTIGSRLNAIRYVSALRPDINIHLLGFSNNVMNDIICAKQSAFYQNVRGIDSAVPLRYDYSVPNGVYTPTAKIPPRPQDWFEEGVVMPKTLDNLANMRRWVAYHKHNHITM